VGISAGVANDLRVQQTLADLPLDDVAAPTLIVHSRYDGDVPYRNATHAHARIPGSELVTVEQFGHLLWWGDAAVAAQLRARVEAFLRPRGVRGRGQAGTGGPGDQEGCGADG
jgi:pimeloyl-ACP methyl ester carboxylesterase